VKEMDNDLINIDMHKLETLNFIKKVSSEPLPINKLTALLVEQIYSLTNSKSAALFLLNDLSFEFELMSVFPANSNEKVQNIFNELITQNILANIFFTKEKIITQLENNLRATVINLENQDKVYGLILLLNEKDPPLTDQEEYDLRIISSFFTLKYFHVKEKRTSFNNTIIESEINILENGITNLRTILNSINEGILVVEKGTDKVIDLNDSAVDLIKGTKNDLIGKNKNEFFLPFDKNIFKDEIFDEDEALLIKTDGTPVPVILRSKEVNFEGYNYEIISILDITDRKMMEDKIQEARFQLECKVEERTKELANANKILQKEIIEKEIAQKEILKLISAINQSNSLIIITDLNFNIEYVNSAVVKKTEYLEKELIGQNLFLINSNKTTKEKISFIKEKLQSGKNCTQDLINKTKNGKFFWVRANFSPVINSEGKIINYISVQEDITQQKEYELQLIYSKEKAEKSEKAKSILLANMSHEFRTPLISILGFGEFLELELTENEHIEMAKAIRTSGKRLLNSLDSILLLSELESTELSFSLKEEDIIPTIQKTLNNFKSEAQKKSVELKFETNFDAFVTKTDSKYLSVILHHLIDNAIKFTNQGEVVVKLSFDEANKKISLSVKDTGIGISEKDQQIIFEAFKQASEGYSRDYEGFGLGLTIAKKMVQLLNGEIIVKSTPKVGSIFTVILPHH